MVALADDVPTLRLVTLRGLLRGTRPPVVLGAATSVEAARVALQGGVVGVVVDSASVLVGTIELHELAGCPGDAVLERVMSRTLAVLGPEQDIDAARAAMRAHDVDRVVVVHHDGSLLGILCMRDLGRRRAA